MSASNRPHVVIAPAGRCQPNPGSGHWIAVLTTIVNNQPKEKVLSGTIEDANNQRADLLATVSALEYLKAPCRVTLKPLSKYVVDGLTKWLTNWQQSNWQTTKRKPVKNADLWKRIVVQMARHDITVTWLKTDDDVEQLQQVRTLLDYPPATTPSESNSSDNPYRLLIAGSRHASENMLEYARRAVAQAVKHGWTIVVGDNANGVDAAVVQACIQQQVSTVIVVGIADKPRNGGVPAGRYVKRGLSYSDRDRQMVKASDRGLFIWDGQSKGTHRGYIAMKDMGKPCDLINFARTFA